MSILIIFRFCWMGFGIEQYLGLARFYSGCAATASVMEDMRLYRRASFFFASNIRLFLYGFSCNTDTRLLASIVIEYETQVIGGSGSDFWERTFLVQQDFARRPWATRLGDREISVYGDDRDWEN